jgi:hypothetical protein
MQPRKKYSEFIKIAPNEIAQNESSQSSSASASRMTRQYNQIKTIPLDKTEKSKVYPKIKFHNAERSVISESQGAKEMVPHKPQRAVKLNSFTSQDGSEDDNKLEQEPIISLCIFLNF